MAVLRMYASSPESCINRRTSKSRRPKVKSIGADGVHDTHGNERQAGYMNGVHKAEGAVVSSGAAGHIIKDSRVNRTLAEVFLIISASETRFVISLKMSLCFRANPAGF